MNTIKERTTGKRKTHEEIASARLRTSTVNIEINYEEFFSKYSIVSYTCDGKKNIPYERLSDTPYLSVSGIYDFWRRNTPGFTTFFVLINKSEEYTILEELRNPKHNEYGIKCKIDTLENYKENTKKRILTSLLLNSLGKSGNNSYYNSGDLYLSDDTNFTYSKKKSELVCLRININRYLVLTANTVTFSQCDSERTLQNKCNRPMFRLDKPLIGDSWSGMTLLPFIPKEGTNSINIQDIYIKKKYNPYKHNVVAQFNTKEEELHSSKIYALTQIVQKLNERYKQFFKIGFIKYDILLFDECKSIEFERKFEGILQDYFFEKEIQIENTLPDNPVAHNYCIELKKEILSLMGENNILINSEKKNSKELVIRVVNSKPRPKDKEEIAKDQYAKLETIKKYNVIQHSIAKEVKRSEPKINKNGKLVKRTDPIEHEAKRILLELLVKDCNARLQLDKRLVANLPDWNFFLFKAIDDLVYGALLQVDNDGRLLYSDYGKDYDFDTDNDLRTIVRNKFKIKEYEIFSSAKEHRILWKEGNIYCIVDTDENPVLDTDLIDNLYIRHQDAQDNGRSAANEMRQATNIDNYLSGYIGLRLWESEGLSINNFPSYAYMVGETKGKSTVNRKFKGAPRTKRIFVISATNPEKIQEDVLEIINMLKNIFGRYGEFEAYPYPFKFIREYLNKVNLEDRGYGWDRLNWKRLNNIDDADEDEDSDDSNNETDDMPSNQLK